MPKETANKKQSVLLRYPRDWWSYLCGPASFLVNQDLKSDETIKRSIKNLLLGLGGVIAFSAINMKLSAFSWGKESEKFFEGRVLVNMLFQACIIIAFLSHLIARFLNGRSTLRETVASFSFTFGFVWPTTALAFILIAWYIQLTTGLLWTALPPFDVPFEGGLERTTRTILLVSAAVTAYLWLIGYVLYCYGCAVWASHRFGWVRSSVVVIITLTIIYTFENQLTKITFRIADLLDPLITWLLKIIL